MSSAAMGLIVFACVFGAAMLGMFLRAVLPQHHLSTETKDTVKLAMGLVATMSALVLGLLVASAKGAYDTEKAEVTQMASRVIFLDRLLAMYGPETRETRALLREIVERAVVRLWPDDKAKAPMRQAQLEPNSMKGEALYAAIQNLSPQTDTARSLKSQALSTTMEIGQMRWLLFEQSGSSISMPLLVIVVSWLAILFLSFGVFAPGNGTVVVSLMVAALSVSGAMFLILELDHPFGGLIRISSDSMLNALKLLGQ